MNEENNSQEPVYVVQQISPETEGAASTAMWLETIFGFFSLLGIGHVYTGRVALGIGLMVGWWIFIAVSWVVSTMTLGFAACLFIPLFITIPIISGVQARTFMRKKGGGGDWKQVAGVAGGGCLLVIIILVVIFGIFGAAFFGEALLN